MKRPASGFREIQGLHRTSQNTESGLRFPPIPGEALPHQPGQLSIPSSPSWGSSPSQLSAVALTLQQTKTQVPFQLQKPILLPGVGRALHHSDWQVGLHALIDKSLRTECQEHFPVDAAWWFLNLPSNPDPDLQRCAFQEHLPQAPIVYQAIFLHSLDTFPSPFLTQCGQITQLIAQCGMV